MDFSLGPYFFVIVIAMARMMAALTVTPFLAKEMLPGTARNAVAISLCLTLVPLLLPTVPAKLDGLMLFSILVKEVVLGVLIGYVSSLAFWVADSVGFFIDNQRGTTMASVFNPLTGDQTSPTGIFLTQTITVLFFTTGGFLLFLGGLFQTYVIWPVFSYFPRFTPDFPVFILGFLDLLISLTMVFAAPIIICLFLAEFGLGLMNRFAPQLNVFSLSMPVKGGLASFILVIYMYHLMDYFKGLFVRGIDLMKGLPTLLGS